MARKARAGSEQCWVVLDSRKERRPAKERQRFWIGVIDAEVGGDFRIEAAERRDIESRRFLTHRFEQRLDRVQGQLANEGVSREERVAPSQWVPRELAIDDCHEKNRDCDSFRSRF